MTTIWWPSWRRSSKENKGKGWGAGALYHDFTRQLSGKAAKAAGKAGKAGKKLAKATKKDKSGKSAKKAKTAGKGRKKG